MTTLLGRITHDPVASKAKHPERPAIRTSFGLIVEQHLTAGGEGPSLIEVGCVGEVAEQVMARARRGDRARVIGRIRQRSWTTSAGEVRSVAELLADEVLLVTNDVGADL